ncbi:MAG TPA: hypothetical protein IAA33_05785 [Candidatus Helicobacter avicola]|nr:hypothetical protein [Candidatus Helicobacter avicola]
MVKITEFRLPSAIKLKNASKHYKFVGKSGCVYSSKHYWVDFVSLRIFVIYNKFNMNAFKPIDSFVGYA